MTGILLKSDIGGRPGNAARGGMCGNVDVGGRHIYGLYTCISIVCRFLSMLTGRDRVETGLPWVEGVKLESEGSAEGQEGPNKIHLDPKIVTQIS